MDQIDKIGPNIPKWTELTKWDRIRPMEQIGTKLIELEGMDQSGPNMTKLTEVDQSEPNGAN